MVSLRSQVRVLSSAPPIFTRPRTLITSCVRSGELNFLRRFFGSQFLDGNDSAKIRMWDFQNVAPAAMRWSKADLPGGGSPKLTGSADRLSMMRAPTGISIGVDVPFCASGEACSMSVPG